MNVSLYAKMPTPHDMIYIYIYIYNKNNIHPERRNAIHKFFRCENRTQHQQQQPTFSHWIVIAIWIR